ncbi:MAG TPA: hypothetical protein VFR02_00765 [bacterium]|nr:hypothetical protein [bacterium]
MSRQFKPEVEKRMNSSPAMNFRVVAAALMLGLGWTSPLFADIDESAPDDFIHQRTYFGIMGAYGSIDKGKDFNGTVLLTGSVGSSELEADGIPAFDPGYGFSVVLGHRDGAYAGELGFTQTYHTASFTGGTNVTGQNTALYHVLSFDFKRYFLEKLPVQPFVALGLNYTWIDVEDASALVQAGNSTPLAEGSLSIDGLGLDLGAGLEVYMGDGFSLVGGAYERFTGFSGVTGIERASLTPATTNSSSFSLNSTGINFVAGCTVALGAFPVVPEIHRTTRSA